MDQGFTDRARKVMQLANQEAHRFNHEFIGTHHILLGLVKEDSGVAAYVLKKLDIDLRKIRLEVEKVIQHGPGGEQVVRGRLPQTPRAKKAIEYSIEEARGLNHTYVGTEHLLLGLLREEESVAAQVLMNLGLTIDRVRAGVLKALTNPQGYSRDGSKSGFCQNLFSLLGLRKSRSPEAADVPMIVAPSRAEAVVGRPESLTSGQLRAIQQRVQNLTEQKDHFVAAQDFENAARLGDEVMALQCLLAWYEKFRE